MGAVQLWRIVGIVTNQPRRWVRLMESGERPTDRCYSIETLDPPNPYMMQVQITVRELHAIATAAGLAPAPWSDIERGQTPRYCGGDHCSHLWNLPCDWPSHNRQKDWPPPVLCAHDGGTYSTTAGTFCSKCHLLIPPPKAPTITCAPSQEKGT